MTWNEIKAAVEKAGIAESSEITEIRCEHHDGSKTFHVVRLGHTLMLHEAPSADEAIRECAGCAA
jgi:hypothetical protein